MFVITETGHEPYLVTYESQVVDFAMDFAQEHGHYSGMEDWDEGNVREWITNEMEQKGYYTPAGETVLELYISGPEGHEFIVRRDK